MSSEPQQVKQERLGMADFVSLPGIKWVTEPKVELHRRLLWSLLMLGAAIFLFYHFYERALHYSNNPAAVNMESEIKSSLPYPAVTVCNKNALIYYPTMDVIKSAEELMPTVKRNIQEVLASRGDATRFTEAVLRFFQGNPVERGTQEMNGTRQEEESIADDPEDKNVRYIMLSALLGFRQLKQVLDLRKSEVLATNFLRDAYYSFFARDKVMSNFSVWTEQGVNRSEEFRLYNWTDFYRRRTFDLDPLTMTQCAWAGRSCSEKDFKRRLLKHDTLYQTSCHTFNSDGALRQSGKGANRGLVLNLKSHPEYSILRGEPGGYRVIVHDPAEYPDIEDNISVDDGSAVDIRLGYKKMIFLEKYSPCKGSKKLKYSTKRYTNLNCMIECRSDFLLKRCGCRPSYLPGLNSTECNMVSVETLNCLDDAPANIDTCKCPSECEQVTYNPEIRRERHSVADKEIRALKRGFDAMFAAGPPVKLHMTAQDRAAFLGESVRVFYQSMNSLTIKQEPAFTWLALLSDLGGALGLILGGCLLTLVEILEYFVSRHLLKKRAKQKGVGSSTGARRDGVQEMNGAARAALQVTNGHTENISL